MSMEELARRIFKFYGYADIALFAPGKGYRNHSFPAQLQDGSKLNLMIYKREAGMRVRIENANQVSNFVFNHGLPARHTNDARIVQISSLSGESFAALYDYLPGTTIPWEAYTMKHIKSLGKTLSDMHAILQKYDSATLPKVVDEYTQIVSRMQDYFTKFGVRQAMRQKLGITISPAIFDDFEILLKVCNHLPDQQALHMDFVRSNILFSESNGELMITGILDFEKAAIGSPLFDIARTLAFLLVDCKYKQPDKIRKYFLHSGYRKRGVSQLKTLTVTVSAQKILVLDQLLNLFLLYDFYKFLRHNPYEYLEQNEHFVRTRDTLLDAQLIE